MPARSHRPQETSTPKAGAVPFRGEMEGAFGEDFGGVGATLGNADMLGMIGANAAASGEDVSFADPNPDKETVAHELAHVVQSRHAGTEGVAAKGVSSPSSAGEQQAAEVGRAVAGGDSEAAGELSGQALAAPAAVSRDAAAPAASGGDITVAAMQWADVTQMQLSGVQSWSKDALEADTDPWYVNLGYSILEISVGLALGGLVGAVLGPMITKGLQKLIPSAGVAAEAMKTATPWDSHWTETASKVITDEYLKPLESWIIGEGTKKMKDPPGDSADLNDFASDAESSLIATGGDLRDFTLTCLSSIAGESWGPLAIGVVTEAVKEVERQAKDKQYKIMNDQWITQVAKGEYGTNAKSGDVNTAAVSEDTTTAGDANAWDSSKVGVLTIHLAPTWPGDALKPDEANMEDSIGVNDKIRAKLLERPLSDIDVPISIVAQEMPAYDGWINDYADFSIAATKGSNSAKTLREGDQWLARRALGKANDVALTADEKAGSRQKGINSVITAIRGNSLKGWGLSEVGEG